MDKDGKKRYNPFIDSVEPVWIDNFLNIRSAVCKELLGEAAVYLKENGWEYDFALYYHDTKEMVRLYLRLAYVGSVFLDGTWDDIKRQIPSLIPLVKAVIELRKYKNLDLKWIHPNLKLLEWTNVENKCISCETYLTSKRGLR